MAREPKKNPNDYTVEEKLKALYLLQTLLSGIDRIKTIRGELPLEVQDLEDEVEGLSTRIENLNKELTIMNAEIEKMNQDNVRAKEQIAKYTSQQDDVRNNREYDMLSKEIDYEQLNIQLNEKHIKEGQQRLEVLKKEIEDSRLKREERINDLDEKKQELDDIISETKLEEEKLREKAKSLELQIEPRLLQAFKRIRKNSRNGLGITCVERGACGGCFNRIPAQRQLDIRMRKKIIVCEYCGKIMVDAELAQEVKDSQVTKRKRTTKRAANETGIANE